VSTNVVAFPTRPAADVPTELPAQVGGNQAAGLPPAAVRVTPPPRSEATQISKVPRPVVSGHLAVGFCDIGRSCPVSRGCASLSGRGTPVGNVLVPICGGRVCARSLRLPGSIGRVSLQDLEIAAAQLWPQTRSQGYFEGWRLVEGGRGSACRPQ
jgi:hypothetical protein